MINSMQTGASGTYLWTNHAQVKMRQYRLSEQRVRRVIRHPTRTEQGILQGAVAVMQPSGGKKYSEIWVMYLLRNGESPMENEKLKEGRIKIITAWRYPGKSPERDPVPAEILREVAHLLGGFTNNWKKIIN